MNRPYSRALRRIVPFALLAAAAWAQAQGDTAALQRAQEAIDDHDYAQALAHYRQAAEQGSCHAARIAGLMLLYGQRLYGPAVTADRDVALRYLRGAAALGCDVSNTTLARLSGG